MSCKDLRMTSQRVKLNKKNKRELLLSFKEFKHQIAIKLQEKFNMNTTSSSNTTSYTSPLLIRDALNSTQLAKALQQHDRTLKFDRSITQLISKLKANRSLNAAESARLFGTMSNSDLSSSLVYANLSSSGEVAANNNLLDTDLCLQCPLSLHAKLSVDKLEPLCKCKKTAVPVLRDLELDYLLDFLPSEQLLVLAIIDSTVSTVSTSTSTVDEIKMTIQAIIEEIYAEANRTRMQPCKESLNDKYRYMFYDMSRAVEDSNHEQPLLYIRHNVIPGMVLVNIHRHFLLN